MSSTINHEALAHHRRPWRRATAWLLLLGPLFFLTYGWANDLAAARSDVGSIVFAWEQQIPFWAWTILPYWSIDAFYAISLYICRDRHELDRHALRLLTAQAIAVTCFVLWPLRFSFVKPDVDGVFGLMFDALGAFDQPFNQAPSLHIVLLVLLWLRFGAHISAGWRWMLHLWAVLIGGSVLTTFQHHFIDIPTGVLAGFLCAWLWPMQVATPWRAARLARDPARWRLAGLYFSGAMVFAAVAVTTSAAALWLLWPAVALLLVALNYAWIGAAGFQKQADGQLSHAARWLYAPYLLAARFNAWVWTRTLTCAVEVADGVWIGRLADAARSPQSQPVIDVCAELPAARDGHVAAYPMLDLVAADATTLTAAVNAIEHARREGDSVLVCCALGYSRSALTVAAWLLRSGRAADVEAAVERVRAARPAVVLREPHRRLLAGVRPISEAT
ncbi:MAG: phosphatase PAP2/dual specificity phosphatase family protein [Pseudomarimonas sp.]